MSKQPLVFSFVREQSVFLTALIALLTFLAVLSLGVTIGIGGAVGRWNSRMDTFGTIQVLPGGDFDAAQKLAAGAKKATVIPDADVAKMLRPWLGSSDALSAYVPKVLEVEFKDKAQLRAFADKANGLSNTRFVSYSDGAKNITAAGWQIMVISTFVMLLVLAAIGLCISYITRNITMIHKRELEILTEIGASDGFVARQMQTIITRIGALAAVIGLVAAVPFLLLIVTMARNTRIGLMAQMTIPMGGWIAIAALPIAIIILTAWLTRRTTLRILGNK